MPVLQEWVDEKTIINQPWNWEKWWPTSKSREFFEEQIKDIL